MAAIAVTAGDAVAQRATIAVKAPVVRTLGAHRRDLDVLVRAYPEFLKKREGDTLVWVDGTRMVAPYPDTTRTADAILETPTIADIFAWPYSTRDTTPPTTDPGRARPTTVFDRMYGDCRKGGVERDLVPVRWVRGGAVRITRRNGVARQLALVVRDLEQLGPAHAKYLASIGGTFNCRAIAGTTRSSAHAYGVAIDLNVAYSDYWQWSRSGTYRNRIPLQIVEVFERHGFIWGGRWAHFDTMHFEYRPELIATVP